PNTVVSGSDHGFTLTLTQTAQAPSTVTASLGLAFTSDPGSSGVKLGTQTSADSFLPLPPLLTAGADLHLHADLRFGGGTGQPGVSADLGVNWSVTGLDLVGGDYGDV